ncbi:MAG: conjugal transfer protein TraO [Clostridia bacterium]|nr:conjugal transfer protein TraO [Clostridia bacterium]
MKSGVEICLRGGLVRLLVLTGLAWALSVMPAWGQRTSNRQLYLDFTASSSVVSDPSLGGGVSFGQYLLASRWDAGVDFLMKRDGKPYYPVYAQASYMFRFCANRSRSAHLYGGVGVLMGAEVSTPEEMTPSTGYTDEESGVGVDFSQVEEVQASVAGVAFLYGVQARLEAELFIARKVAIVGAVRMPLTFGSAHSVFNLVGTVGLRFNI